MIAASVKDTLRTMIPLPARMRLAAWLTKQSWLVVPEHAAMGLVRDLLVRDPKVFHKFLWANHFMGYARWYDSEEQLFAPDRIEPSRVEFFRDLLAALAKLGVDPSDVRSVLEVGCSLGYLLRHLEMRVFPGCRDLVGVDIDGPAIDKGARFLAGAGSRVALIAGDMENLDTLTGPRRFDVIFAAGVLSYLNEADATRMVARMLRRTDTMLALAGLAWTERSNSTLTASIESPGHRGQWIHNFDALVRAAGGRVVHSRWEGGTLYNLQTICFCFAVPERLRLSTE